ncbi:hypothetical protein ACFFSW_07335 [Saccharothrix longispora]|uniref:Epi-isozizaene synthase n=1 Tax=Saccharothrix longispora TaxID=33920 RepID=A0ABU1PSR4_9PSEU|nr:hypothetical protein [Saccharothrix longispora]MDR6593686.1 epi-isozizaene synthase [Saccharothrix longispora]
MRKAIGVTRVEDLRDSAMRSFGIDDSQIPTSRARFTAEAHENVKEWASRFGLISGPDQLRAFDDLAYTALFARGCPHATLEDLTLFSQWFAVLFFLDDQQDIAVFTGRSGSFAALQDELGDILLQGGTGANEDGIGLPAAVADLCRRTRPVVSDRWWNRFTAHAESVFAAQRAENRHRLEGTVPSVGEFITMRREASTVEICFDLIEACERGRFPNAVRYSPAARDYVAALNDFTTWTNDLFGVERDAANADPNNYVLVRQHADGCDRQHAVKTATEDVRRLFGTLAELRRRVEDTAFALGFDEEVRGGVRRVLDGWYAWAVHVPLSYLAENSRLIKMDEVPSGTPPRFTEDVLPDGRVVERTP